MLLGLDVGFVVYGLVVMIWVYWWLWLCGLIDFGLIWLMLYLCWFLFCVLCFDSVVSVIVSVIRIVC